jgi:DNA polymerase-3 subunit gamma/tau
MAALAAARAASAKAGSTSKPAASKQENDVAPIVTPVVPVSPVASAMPAPVAVAKIAPAVPQLVTPALVPSTEPAPVPTPAAARAPQEMEPVGMDDMPPPWDDDVWQASAFASAPASAPISSPAVTRNLQQNTVAESVVPVAVSETPAVATATVPPAANVEPVAMDRTLWSGPVSALEWDGNWPVLAASLPVRGVAQQLAQQSELIHCKQDGNAFVFELRVPLSTLLSAGSIDKLAAALSERFGKNIRVESKIGAVELTANAKAVADREVRQQQAELAIQNDSFVQTLMREFGAAIVTGSVRPI